MRPTILAGGAAALTASLALGAACARHIAAPTTVPNAERGLTWGPAPAVFPAGAQLAVLQGDPSKPKEQFTIRLRMPDGYRIPPHTHPTDEHVTVVEGTFLVGMGPQFRADSMTTLDVGAFVTAPAGHAHYAAARGATVVQVHAIGPFALTYVNPSDVPAAARVGSH
jgi:quercetin dioxygenase-like cupin family protein